MRYYELDAGLTRAESHLKAEMFEKGPISELEANADSDEVFTLLSVLAGERTCPCALRLRLSVHVRSIDRGHSQFYA